MSVKLRDRKLPSGKRILYLDIYHKGKRRSESLGIYLDSDREQNKERKKIAEKVRAEREVELQNLNYNFIPDYKKRQNLIAYIEDISQEYKNNSVILGTIEQLKKFKGNIITFEEIDEKWLIDFKKFLLKSDINQNSASTYFQKLKMVLKKAKLEKIISVNPAEFVPHIKMIPAQKVYLEFDELQTLIKTKCTDDQIERAFIFSCFTGLRFSDVKKLTWNDLKENRLEIQQQKTKNPFQQYLHPTAIDILQEQRKLIDFETNLVFRLPSKWWTNKVLKEWCKKAEINKSISFHTSRHTFATLCLTSGVDIYTVSSLLDHQSFKTTQVYAKIIDPKRRNAIDSLPQLQLSS